LELFSCADADAMLDQVVEQMPDGIDRDCVRDALDGVDLSEMVQGSTPPAELTQALSECTGG
jgi:hypothetical protein